MWTHGTQVQDVLQTEASVVESARTFLKERHMSSLAVDTEAWLGMSGKSIAWAISDIPMSRVSVRPEMGASLSSQG